MDLKERETLLAKYWRGETTLEEEAMLRLYFVQKEDPAENESRLFAYFEQQKDLHITDDLFDEQVVKKITETPADAREFMQAKMVWWSIAAALILMFCLGYIFRSTLFEQQNKTQAMVADTYSDPQKAYEETKKALLFISSKLDEGINYTAEISKFDDVQKKIKSKEK